MTIPEAVQSASASERRIPFRDVRDCAVSFSLTDVKLDEATKIVDEAASAWLGAEMAANDLALARALFQQRIAADDVIQREAAVAAEAEAAERILELERQKLTLEDTSREAAEAIRRLRHSAEEQRLQEELAKIDAECDAAVSQLSRERVEAHVREVEQWKTSDPQRQAEIKVLQTARKEIADRLETTRTRYRDLMNPFMTYHASRFLIWAGYSAIAATGAAVTFLLDKHSDHSVLSDVFSATVASMDTLRRGWSYPLLVAAIYLLIALGSIAGAFWLTDYLMRRFYRPWKNEERRRSDFAPARLGLRGSIGRRTYVQTLVALPYVYAAGLFLAFLTYRVPAGPLNRQFLGYVIPTFAHTFIGSSMTLLAASIFVMYITNIFEQRVLGQASVKRTWRQAWEIGVIPAALIVAVAFAVFGTEDRQIWGGLTAFMLIGSVALAYGLVYRGMFNELRYQESILEDHGSQIESLLQPPPLPEAVAEEAKEISRVRAGARTRRQAILDLQRKRTIRRLFLSTDDQDASLVSQFEVALSALERFFGRKVAPRPEFYRDIDREVAPEEVARRQKADGELQRLALDIDQARKNLAALGDTTRACENARHRKRELDERVETAAKEKAELEARLRADTAFYILDFRRAYALGSSVKGLYDTVHTRTSSAVNSARWRPPAAARRQDPDSPPAAPVPPVSTPPVSPPPVPVDEPLEAAS